MSGIKYLNLDVIVPDEQVLELAGRRFDIAKTSARKTTELLKVAAWAASPDISGDQSKSYEAYEKEMQALIAVLGKDQDGKVATFDWVVDNVNNAQLAAIIKFVGECLQGDQADKVADGEVPANFTPNRQQRRSIKKK